MMKVFQRIRRKLLDEGHLKKYLVYAIGEILLVVIGILIALQVNNWNEWRKLRKQEINVYNEILSELIETKEELSTDTRGVERNLKSAIAVRGFLIMKVNSADSLKRYIPELYNQSHFNPKTSAFESLKSTGLGILSNDSVRIKVTNLYQLEFPYFTSSSAQIEHLKFPDQFLPILMDHLKIDTQKINSDIASDRMMVNRRYFPYEIKDLNTLFNDERFIIEVQHSINWRSARLRQHRSLQKKLERVEKMIMEELLRLK